MMEFDRRTVICAARNGAPPTSQEPVAKDRPTDMLLIEEGTIVSGAHQLDESHRDWSLPHELRPSREALLQAIAKQYRIHLDSLELQTLRNVQAGKHLPQAVMPGDCGKNAPIERIDADIEVSETCARPLGDVMSEIPTIGSEGNLANTGLNRNSRNQVCEILPDGWLTARNTHLANAKACERTNE